VGAALGLEKGTDRDVTAELPGRSGKRRRQANRTGGRSVRQEVKLTPEESAALRLRAAKLGISVPRLLVESALAERETATEHREQMAELFALRRLGAAIGNNVNQLARKANIDDEFPAEAAPVLDQISRLMVRIDATLNTLAGRR
jgi:hypothetical protein